MIKKVDEDKKTDINASKNIKGKIKKNLPLILGTVIIVGILGCFVFNGTQKTSNSLSIQTLSPTTLESTIEKEKDLFVIMGESTADTTKQMLQGIIDYKSEVEDNIYYLDTSYYTLSFASEDIDESERQEAVNNYIEFMNKYSINTLPTVVYFKNGKITDSFGKYIDDKYSLASTEKKEKETLLNNANNDVKSWILKK